MNLNDMGHRRMRPNHQEHHCHNDVEPSEASARLPRRNRPNEEEKFGKLKFQIPPFKGDVDPEAYMDWELKVDKIFRAHNYSEEKKVAMASLEFTDYANIWWEDYQAHLERENQPPIDT